MANLTFLKLYHFSYRFFWRTIFKGDPGFNKNMFYYHPFYLFVTISFILFVFRISVNVVYYFAKPSFYITASFFLSSFSINFIDSYPDLNYYILTSVLRFGFFFVFIRTRSSALYFLKFLYLLN